MIAQDLMQAMMIYSEQLSFQQITFAAQSYALQQNNRKNVMRHARASRNIRAYIMMRGLARLQYSSSNMQHLLSNMQHLASNKLQDDGDGRFANPWQPKTFKRSGPVPMKRTRALNLKKLSSCTTKIGAWPCILMPTQRVNYSMSWCRPAAVAQPQAHPNELRHPV